MDAPPDRKLSAQAASGDPTAAAAMVGPPAPSDSVSSKYVDGTLPPPFYTRDSALDDTLVFESRFESGNLRRAIQVPSTKRAPCHALHGIAICSREGSCEMHLQRMVQCISSLCRHPAGRRQSLPFQNVPRALTTRGACRCTTTSMTSFYGQTSTRADTRSGSTSASPTRCTTCRTSSTSSTWSNRTASTRTACSRSSSRRRRRLRTAKCGSAAAPTSPTTRCAREYIRGALRLGRGGRPGSGESSPSRGLCMAAQNNIKRKNGHYYYTFTCTYQFSHSRDTVYLAYCYPYTYTDLQRYLRHLEEDPKCRQRFRRRVLCQVSESAPCPPPPPPSGSACVCGVVSNHLPPR